MAGSVKGDGTEEFKGLRITSLDDDRDEEEEQKEPDVAMDDDDEEEEDEEARNSVILGFVKKTKKSRSLLRHFFPSKAGGVPKTCRPEDLAAATYAVNLCNLCFRYMRQRRRNLHFTDCLCLCVRQWRVFVVINMNNGNASGTSPLEGFPLPIKPFYSSEPPKKDSTEDPLMPGAALWNWCGTGKGSKRCTGCRKTLHCSEKHWVKHSRSGHEHDCQRLRIQLADSSSANSETTSAVVLKVTSNNLWPDYKIIEEPESSYDTEMPDESVGTNSLVSSNRMDDGLMSIADNFTGDGDRKSWASFHV